MFTLTIDNRQLILDPDFGVPLLYKNPCWYFNEIPGPLCLDVTIPDNDVNRNYLGFPGRFAKMATRSNDRKFPGAELRWRGYLYIYGTLVITKPTEKGYSGYIQSELRNLSDAQREKLISDHNLKGELTFQNKLNYDPATDLYCTIKVKNAGFWVDKGEMEAWKKVTENADGSTKTEDTEREVLTRKFDNTADFMVNSPDLLGVKVLSGDSQAIVVSPFPFLHRLIDELLQENKLYMRNNFLKNDDVLKTLALYNNVSICKAAMVLNTANLAAIGKYHGDWQNVNMVFSPITSQLWAADKFYLKKLLPKLELNELLLSVQNLTNTFFHFTGINDVDCIDRETLFGLEPFDLSAYRISRWLPGKRQNLVLKFRFDHDPDDQEFNENFTDIGSREEDIQDPVDVLPDLDAIASPAIGEIRLVKSEKMYYEYRQETVATPNGESEYDTMMWAPLTIDLQDFKYNPSGDETEDIETKFSTLRAHENGYPVAYQKGNSSQFSQFSENFSPRLLFYNGNNTGGSTSSGGLEMNWKSIVEKRYRRTAAFYANALPVEANFRFPGNIFYKVLNEIYLPFLDKDGSFFIKEMDVQSNNSEYVLATLTVFKIEDNVFNPATGTVDGGGEHAGSVFTPKFVGVTATGWPILVDAAGVQRSMPVFGDISAADFAKHTCIAWDPEDKLLFVGGNNGQLHVCDLADVENIRYKTIQVFPGTDEVSCVSLTTFSNGTGKALFVGRANGCTAWLQPYHVLFDDYVSNQATQIGAFNNGTGIIREIMVSGGYYYACSKNGEIHRVANWQDVWQECGDISAEFIAIDQTQNHIWVAEINDDSLFSDKTGNPAHFTRFNGLSGTKTQKPRGLQPLLADKILWICDDNNECIWLINEGISNGNITPAGIQSAGGACFDGVKYAHISVKDSSGYMKIATYNANVIVPEAVWSYLNVSSFFTKLFIW